MASPSSSMSQESVDHDDGAQAFSGRPRTKNIRLLRARGAQRTDREMAEGCDGSGQNGDVVGDGDDHDRPVHSRDRVKDKRNRPSHLSRGKLPKDKRKLREKRRSTGVVHLPSTESTGDSLDDEDTDKERPLMETSRNTKYNEIIDADNPQTPCEDHGRYAVRRNKSPSDLEADLEDNQDYDSTVSQSDSSLMLARQDPSPVVAPAQPNSSRFRSVAYPNQQNAARNYQNLRSETQTKTSYSPMVLTPYSDKNEQQTQPSVLRRYQPEKIAAEKDTYKSEFSLRTRNRDIMSSVNTRVLLPKENIKESVSRAGYMGRQTTETSAALQIDKLQEENKRLQRLLEEKNRRIEELEMKISVLNTHVTNAKDQNEELHGENSALLRALTRLTTQ